MPALIRLPQDFALPGELAGVYGRNIEIPLPPGDAGTRATIQVIRAIIHDSDRRGLVQQLSQAIAREVPALQDNAARKINMLRYLYAWLQKHVTFMPDTFGKEQLRHVNQIAHELLTNGGAAIDCEDLGMLGAAIARCWGFRTAIIAVGRQRSRPYEHCYFGVELGGRDQLFPMDPQTSTPAGSDPGFARKLFLWVD